MQQMITPAQARRIVLENISSLNTETIPHAGALGRTLAVDIISEMQLPPFANSAMDGYALLAADVAGASESSPVTLRVLETIGAGDVPSRMVTTGTCAKIMTGATVPAGADAVIMREDTRQAEGEVQILESVRVGQNIRPPGEDVQKGETVLRQGTLVRPAEWAMLASLGQAQPVVYKQPRAAIITTGKELVAVDVPLEEGQIRDSNSFALVGLCQGVGAQALSVRVGDELDDLRSALAERADGCDCIITSGGVSAGDFDPVRDVLLDMQEKGEAEIHFWKIAMKPGKPVMFATLNNGVPVFGLPGNPVSVMVAWEQFVRPALLKMQGRSRIGRLEVPVKMLSAFKSPVGKEEFVRAFVAYENGIWQAKVPGEQGSGRLSTMTRANALITVPADTTRVEEGQTLTAQLLDCGEWV